MEHRRPSTTTSEVSEHINIDAPWHSVDIDKVRVLDCEPKYLERVIQESIYIRALKPFLNKDVGALLSFSRVLSIG